jgi:2-amino-4-hydroxy-6-hydroxymethyldihydropteridine diphosphokinase
MTECRTFIALGTNLPFEGLSGRALLERALERIAAAGVKLVKRSGFWASAPWPAELASQPPFVNAVAEVDPGGLGAPALFAILANVERQFGRRRRERWAARTLDLDILDFQGHIGQVDGLTLPHPRLAERAFVLAPLAELAPDWRHPALGLGAAGLLQSLRPGQAVTRL